MKNFSPKSVEILSGRVVRLLVAFFMSWLVLVCLSPAAAQTARQEPAAYRFGVPPWQKDMTGDDIRGFYRPMLEELTARLGRRIILVGARDYAEISQLLADGKIDIASISPVPYLLARQKNPRITMILTELSYNADRSARQDYYTGHILTLKSRTDINKIEDLKGKRFAFVARESTSGFVVPKNMMVQKGIDWESYFSQSFFLGSHPRVTDALVAGSVDAGATWDFNLSQAIAKHGDVFKVLANSEHIPNLGIAVHPSVSPAHRNIIQQTLTQIDPEKLKGVSAVGYVIRPPETYDRIQRLLK
ncbi:MAG: phosphate/phosphite/phosphonate ABC transporter substrate-binding protein [Pseudomonadota bacterium]